MTVKKKKAITAVSAEHCNQNCKISQSLMNTFSDEYLFLNYLQDRLSD
jgi:hypothetical protein